MRCRVYVVSFPRRSVGAIAFRSRTGSCIIQLKAQGPSRTCNESKEEEAEGTLLARGGWGGLLGQVTIFGESYLR